MSALEKKYRRNFIVAVVLHIALIGVVLCWERLRPEGREPEAIEVAWVPAAQLGEMPAGSGSGKGMYKAPEATVDEPAASVPNNSSSDDKPAPTKSHTDDIAIPTKKTAPKKTVAETKPTKPAPVAKKSTSTTSATATAKANATGKGSSAADIKRRFASALSSSADGTPDGDNKAAGGGTGKGKRIGSPDGSADGVPEGIGQGTPGWQYYKHIQDVLHEAWERTGSSMGGKLTTTVVLRIARDGSIAEVTMRIGSGNSAMDQSVMTAVRQVPRLDPPPDSLVRGQYAIIPVDFQAEG